jgi:phosphoglycerate dehydrogenase-like enzyme
VTEKDFFRGAEVMSMHYVLRDRLCNLVGAKESEIMESSAMLVNTPRGPLVNQDALIDALE